MCTEWEWGRVHHFLQFNQLTPDAVLITHNHSDHVLGTGYLTKAYPGLPVYGSMEDQNHLPPIQIQNRFFGIDAEVQYSPITNNLIEGDTLFFPFEAADDVKKHPIKVIDCPGHSHHGLCYYFPDDNMLFSGDVLFYCSIGRTDFGQAMGGNGPLLVKSIEEKLLSLPAPTKVYPGHGPMTTIETEANYNPYLFY
jgi:glyoxylase-like metal-dependent hydrolase (beta-lactamase superfamily II)